MGNDQLVPTYDMQAAVCDEYITVIDEKSYASDMECFVSLMEKFNEIYGKYPNYPVADIGYGSYNNYIYCKKHGMEKYMKFRRLLVMHKFLEETTKQNEEIWKWPRCRVVSPNV